jgi:hypothetical protein
MLLPINSYLNGFFQCGERVTCSIAGKYKVDLSDFRKRCKDESKDACFLKRLA